MHPFFWYAGGRRLAQCSMEWNEGLNWCCLRPCPAQWRKHRGTRLRSIIEREYNAHWRRQCGGTVSMKRTVSGLGLVAAAALLTNGIAYLFYFFLVASVAGFIVPILVITIL